MAHIQPVILCGGSGTRLWPLSRSGFPKQFLCLTGDDCLFQQAALTMCGDKYAALQGADALVICTEWQQFRVPDFAEMATRMRSKVVVDGLNLYQPHKLQAEGWTYFSLGRTTPSSATTNRLAEPTTRISKE